jgi:hypothetical protein
VTVRQNSRRASVKDAAANATCSSDSGRGSGRGDGVAGAVLGGRGRFGGVHGDDGRHRGRVSRHEPVPVDRRRWELSGRAHPDALRAGGEQGQRLGLDVARHSRLLRAGRGFGSRVRRRGTARRRPKLDLALLRNRILVGSTIDILIGAGTINAMMYLVSLYFQDADTLGFSP